MNDPGSAYLTPLTADAHRRLNARRYRLGDPAVKILNLTPHPINRYGNEDHPVEVIPAEPTPARIATIDLGTNLLAKNGPAVELVEFGHVNGLPEPEPDTWHVVSLPVALASPHRADLLVPYVEVRNDAGTVVGCRFLAMPA